MMFLVAALGILATMALALVRAFLGPTTFDRVLAANLFNTKTMLLIAVAGFLTGRPDWLDVALIYSLMSFLGILALLRFSKYHGLPTEEGDSS